MSRVAGHLHSLNKTLGRRIMTKNNAWLLLTPIQVHVKSSCQTTGIAPCAFI